MKVYKYRDFAKPCDRDFERLATMLNRQFWCTPPAKLNDPEEFVWKCDCSATPETIDLLTEVLIHIVGRSHREAQLLASREVEAGRLTPLAQPIVAKMIQQCRDEIGLVCLGTSPDNEILWQRYGGRGAGVCIELDVPDGLLGTQLRRVQYHDEKRIHIDQFIRAFIDVTRVAEVYTLALLSKPSFWAQEEEIRFISRRQAVPVVIDDSCIARLILGDALTPSVRERIQAMAGAVPVATRNHGLSIWQLSGK